MNVQWNLYNAETIGASEVSRVKRVSLLKGVCISEVATIGRYPLREVPL